MRVVAGEWNHALNSPQKALRSGTSRGSLHTQGRISCIFRLTTFCRERGKSTLDLIDVSSKHICVDSTLGIAVRHHQITTFALLELDKPMPINECIGLACLPSGEDSPGQGCSITGWGTAATGPRPNILQEASVPPLSNMKLCAQKYAEYNSSITHSMLCASGFSESGITDACHGG